MIGFFAIQLSVAAALCVHASEALWRQDFHISGVNVAGIKGCERLAIREIRPPLMSRNSVPVILLHGARVPGLASFDLPVKGGSLAGDIAKRGYRVFVMDACGYGGSSRPGQDGDGSGEPLQHTDAVVRDIYAVVQEVRTRTGARKVALLGWATGGQWAQAYASVYPETVSHLIVLNSLYGGHMGDSSMLGPGTSTADPIAPEKFDVKRFGAFQWHTASSLLPAWNNSIPIEELSTWRDPQVVDAYIKEALASDSASFTHTPPAFRAPSGAMEDSFLLASGKQLWDASRITSSVLIIRSGRDFWSRMQDVDNLRRDLVHAVSVSVLILPNATHYVHLDRKEHGRGRLLDAILRELGLGKGDAGL
jgi:pimeloyl-ACP methyl ester carboxylesterase